MRENGRARRSQAKVIGRAIMDHSCAVSRDPSVFQRRDIPANELFFRVALGLSAALIVGACGLSSDVPAPTGSAGRSGATTATAGGSGGAGGLASGSGGAAGSIG